MAYIVKKCGGSLHVIIRRGDGFIEGDKVELRKDAHERMNPIGEMSNALSSQGLTEVQEKQVWRIVREAIENASGR